MTNNGQSLGSICTHTFVQKTSHISSSFLSFCKFVFTIYLSIMKWDLGLDWKHDLRSGKKGFDLGLIDTSYPHLSRFGGYSRLWRIDKIPSESTRTSPKPGEFPFGGNVGRFSSFEIRPLLFSYPFEEEDKGVASRILIIVPLKIQLKPRNGRMGMGVMRILPLFLILFFLLGILALVIIAWTSLKLKDETPGPGGFVPKNPPGINALSSEAIRIAFSGEQRLPGSDESLPFVPQQEEVDSAKEIERLRMRIVSNLRRHVLNGAKVKDHINQYGVDFTGVKSKGKGTPKEIICKLQALSINTLSENSSPLFKGKSFPNEPLLPRRPIPEDENADDLDRPLYKSCAVVANSAALDGAKHGVDIDSHEFILRFNNAPTEGWRDDVGVDTTLRIVNSQVVTKPQFSFPYASGGGPLNSYVPESSSMSVEALEEPRTLESLWNGTGRYLWWDPCAYTASLDQWILHPDFPLFEKYFTLAEKSLQERNRHHILDCRVIWRLWEILQEYTFARISGTPPTSGFLGIVLALKNCERVDIYEYIPSIRESDRCHYYKKAINPSCTYGSWHPVSAEKLFFLQLTDSTDKEVFIDGVMSIPGVSNYQC